LFIEKKIAIWKQKKIFKLLIKLCRKKKKIIFGSKDLRIGFCRNSALIELDRISALVEFLQNFCVGGISAEFLCWWNFCRISVLVEYL
jgi:hypothetical protein